MPTFTTNALGLTPREAAIDALYRFVTAIDIPSPDLLLSSLITDAIMELSGFTEQGKDRVVGPSGAEITKEVMNAVGYRLDTNHFATNVRCSLDGDRADLTATILAYHFPKGEGLSPDSQRTWSSGNGYECTVVRVGDEWRFERVLIRSLWTLGDADVMKP